MLDSTRKNGKVNSPATIIPQLSAAAVWMRPTVSQEEELEAAEILTDVVRIPKAARLGETQVTDFVPALPDTASPIFCEESDTSEMVANKKPRQQQLAGLFCKGVQPQTLISTSTPLGNSSFISASTVFDEVEKMSTRRL